eukprot:jgi/Undpi1/6110/HiC_scaffold_20.g08595.m1
MTTPVVAACLMGLVIGLVILSKPAPRPRLSKTEKREARRMARRRGRAASSKRGRSNRKETRARLVEQIGVEEFKKIVQKDRREREEQRERLQAAIDNPDSLRLVVDLNLAESASGKEVSSLAKQLCYVYNRVKASSAPPTLTLTSYQGRVATALSNAGAGAWLADRNPLDVFTVFDHHQVVYLSPDAEEPLEEVLTSEVYVVGGIVDRNIDKGLTLAAAKGGGARAVRLPFDEHLPEVSPGDQVLTVCACVGVLMSVHAGEDWRQALEKSVPKRSLASVVQRARGGALREAEGLLSRWELGKVAVASEQDSTSTINSIEELNRAKRTPVDCRV